MSRCKKYNVTRTVTGRMEFVLPATEDVKAETDWYDVDEFDEVTKDEIVEELDLSPEEDEECVRDWMLDPVDETDSLEAIASLD